MLTRDWEGNFIMTKGSIHQDNIRFVNIYESKKGEPKYIKQMLTYIKGERHNYT